MWAGQWAYNHLKQMVPFFRNMGLLPRAGWEECVDQLLGRPWGPSWGPAHQRAGQQLPPAAPGGSWHLLLWQRGEEERAGAPDLLASETVHCGQASALPPRGVQVWWRKPQLSHLPAPMLVLWSSRRACVLSCFSCVWLLVTLWTVACQAPLSMRFSRQKYWSGMSCLSPEDLPDLGIGPVSLTSPALEGRFFTTSATQEALRAARVMF